MAFHLGLLTHIFFDFNLNFTKLVNYYFALKWNLQNSRKMGKTGHMGLVVVELIFVNLFFS